jgi:DsbC/DsbD-like thiol-disulfide interchange protein
MDFGYEDEVLFPLALRLRKTAKPVRSRLHAKVDWLVCREVCIPGKAELETVNRLSFTDTSCRRMLLRNLGDQD